MPIRLPSAVRSNAAEPVLRAEVPRGWILRGRFERARFRRDRFQRAVAAFALAVSAVLSPGGGSAAWAAEPVRIQVDRVIARFSAPETGGVGEPHFIYERELAFEARLMALGDAAFRAGDGRDGRPVEPYRRHHLQSALERHIAEELLASITITPKLEEQAVTAQVERARVMAEEQAGGRDRLLAAARAEGVGALELRRLFRRRALASLYLDRMVAPMLSPTEFELRRVHRTGKTPFSQRPFAEIEPGLRRWYVAGQLRAAAANYYQNARARLRLELY